MSYTITTNWNSIQERNIDPYSKVDSDNHNKLLKVLGGSKAYISGLNISFEPDMVERKMIARIQPGIVVLSYIVIEFKETVTIELFKCPTIPKIIYVVVEYEYQKTKPVPIAVIKSITDIDYNPDTHIVLYSYQLSTWDYPLTSTLWDTYILTNGNDLRKSSSNIPQWAEESFINVNGDTMKGNLLLQYNTNPDEYAALPKRYIEEMISNSPTIIGSGFIKKIGDTVNGDLSFSTGYTIQLGKEPVNNSDAVTKLYVDTNMTLLSSGTYVSKTGDTMSGDLTFATNKTVITTKIPTSNYHVANKLYVDTQIQNHDSEHDDRFIQKNGDTILGNLTFFASKTMTLSMAPTDNMHVVNKGYVDNLINTQIGTVDGFVQKSGDTMTGFLTLNANPLSNLHAVTKQYVDTAFTTKDTYYDNRYLQRSGDIMNGNYSIPTGSMLSIVDAPENNNDASNKKYVDDQIKKVKKEIQGSMILKILAFS